MEAIEKVGVLTSDGKPTEPVLIVDSGEIPKSDAQSEKAKCEAEGKCTPKEKPKCEAEGKCQKS